MEIGDRVAGNERSVRALGVYSGRLTPTLVVVMVGAFVGLVTVGVLRGETRFHPEGAAARSALGAVAAVAFAVAGVALLFAVL